MRDLANRALNITRQLGASYVDVRLMERTTEGIDVKNGRVEGISSGTSSGFNVRVIVDGAWGFASSANLEELIRGIDQGIYVTRFHYTNTVHPVKTLFTGMTRDGTFLIEHGELTSPVKNFRFTQSILDALRDVQALGRERVQCRDYVPVVAPELRTGSFHFTGVTRT